MYVVDPDFVMAYDSRNGQEMAARLRHQTGSTQNAMAPLRETTGDCGEPQSKGVRFALMAVLAMLGVGVGFQLGRDQYYMFKAR